MEFNLFRLCNTCYNNGFSIFEIDMYREDDYAFALFGLNHNKEDNLFEIDILFTCIKIHL
jgi:hypothetical protein